MARRRWGPGRMSHLFCFGLGYSASVLAARLGAQGWTISGTSRDVGGVAALSARGFRGMLFDGTSASGLIADELQRATHVLLSIPPDASGDPALRWHGDDMAASLSLHWIGYFSTVGVYGDSAGAWVDEDTEARPGSERGQRRLDAERAWLSLGEDSRKAAVMFRLPGIYGPGRSTIDDVKAGTARRLIKPGQVFNRIHVDDIASAVQASMGRSTTNRIYNVTDDLPSPPQDVVAYAAQLLGAPIPPDIEFATAAVSAMGRSFYSESKRVSNARMKRELGVTLAYPSYREGLRAIVDAGG